MIKGKDIYQVLSAVVPLYVAMVLGFGSVRWWKILTPEQCSGINRFVAVFAVPFLCFNLIAFNDIYAMNFKFLAGDSLQKVVILLLLFLWNMTRFGSLDWSITLFSLLTMPNTLVMGIPLFRAMYGDFAANLMVQIVVLQAILWVTLLLSLFEYRGAKILIQGQFPEIAGSISTLRAESDVNSLSGREPIQADAEIGLDGKLHVVVRRTNSISSSMGLHNTNSFNNSRSSSHYFANSVMASARVSSLHGVDEICSVHSSRISSFSGNQIDNNSMQRINSSQNGGGLAFSQVPVVSGSASIGSQRKKELHIFVSKDAHESTENEEKATYPLSGSLKKVETTDEGDGNRTQEMPSTSVFIRLVLIMVFRKLIRNANFWANILGLIWSLIAFRVNIKMPTIIKVSITIISNTGMGMAMFSLGLFMALQPKLIACGKKWAVISMAIRFLGGPAVIAATSSAVGIRGVLLNVEIVQAALPQAIISFVFAKEYNLHADIISTSVIFGMVVALPVTIIYYILLGL